jgi:iron complex outermembrane recepter protein
MTPRALRRTLLLAGLAASAFVVPATAQQAGQADTAVLEEIVVTAQRREENLQQVPVSVGILGGDKLDAITASGADIRGLSARVPSLNIESSFGRTFPRFYIRGLGNTDFDLNASQPVSLVYDDVVLENPMLKGFPIFDLDRVEVLRGPQGTLFGRNTPAGIVKFDTKKPGDTFEGYGRINYGRFNALNFEGAVGGPLADGVSVRASAMYQRRSDWIDNVRTANDDKDLDGFEEFAARLQLRFEPTEALSVNLVGQYRDLDGAARVFHANSIRPGTNDLVSTPNGLFPGATNLVYGEFDRSKVSQDGLNFSRLEAWNLGATIAYDFGPVTLTSVTAFWNAKSESRGDIDGGFGASFAPPFGPGFIPFWAQTQDNVPDLDQFTQEIRLASNDWSKLGYQVGFFYFNEKLDIESLSYPTPTSTSPDIFVRQRQESKAWGLFGTLSYALTDQLKVTAGLRYNDDKRDFVAVRTLGFLGPLTAARSVDDEVITWDVSATYAANDHVNLYARIARGYRAPSIQGRILFGNDVSTADSEKVMSYEAGVKSTLADGRARLNVSVFYYDMKDLQLTAVGGTANFNRLVNADKVTGYGFEADLEAKPIDNLLFTAGISYNNTEIKDPGLRVQICGAPCTVPGAVGGLVSIDGNPLPQAPKWTLNATARYGVPVGDGEVFVFTDWAYRSKINFFLYESLEFNDKRMLEGGLRIGYQGADARWEVAGFIRNLTNDVSGTSGIDFNNLTVMVNEPRTWGVEASFKF